MTSEEGTTHSVPNDVRSWTVLIVDDEIDNLGVAEKVLEFHGADVTAYENGHDALQWLETHYPSFVLMDLSMPYIDGWEMLKQIRTNTAWRSIPVIAITAHAMAGDEERVMNAGFDGYISKPFRISTFLEQIQTCLTRTNLYADKEA